MDIRPRGPLADPILALYKPKNEAAFQADARATFEGYGWLVFATWLSKHSPAGEPDLRCFRPGAAVFVELKMPNGKTSPQQVRAAEVIRSAGIPVYEFRPAQWNELVAVAAGETR